MAVIILPPKCFVFLERTVGPKQPSYPLDPGRCIPQRYTIAIVGVSPREEKTKVQLSGMRGALEVKQCEVHVVSTTCNPNPPE
jgi:hypothetical protein